MSDEENKRCEIIKIISEQLTEKLDIDCEIVSSDIILVNTNECSLIDRNPWKGDVADVYEKLEIFLEEIVFYIRDKFNFDADYNICGELGVEIQILF